MNFNFTPNENDVIFGRGNGVHKLTGNERYRAVIRQFKKTYQSAKSTKNKQEIAQHVVNCIAQQRGGTFYHQPKDLEGSDHWVEADIDTILFKVKQALREKRKNVVDDDYEDCNDDDALSLPLPRTHFPHHSPPFPLEVQTPQVQTPQAPLPPLSPSPRESSNTGMIGDLPKGTVSSEYSSSTSEPVPIETSPNANFPNGSDFHPMPNITGPRLSSSFSSLFGAFIPVRPHALPRPSIRQSNSDSNPNPDPNPNPNPNLDSHLPLFYEQQEQQTRQQYQPQYQTDHGEAPTIAEMISADSSHSLASSAAAEAEADLFSMTSASGGIHNANANANAVIMNNNPNNNDNLSDRTASLVQLMQDSLKSNFMDEYEEDDGDGDGDVSMSMSMSMSKTKMI